MTHATTSGLTWSSREKGTKMDPPLWPWLQREEEAASFQQQTQLTELVLDTLWQAGLTTLK